MQSKLKILQIHDYPPFAGGGIEINVSQLSRQLQAMGQDVSIVTSRFSSENYLEKQQGNILMSEGLSAEKVTTLSRLRELIAGADIVHVHFTFSYRTLTRLAIQECLNQGKTCVITLHTAFEHLEFSALSSLGALEREVQLEEIKRVLSSEQLNVIGLCEFAKDTLGKLGIEREVKIIHNGTDLALPVEVESERFAKVDLTFVGEVSGMKGIGYLLDAISILRNQGRDMKLRIIGGGDVARFKSQANYLGVVDLVEFSGYVDNKLIPEALSASRAYIHPSLTEMWPGSVLEAINARKVVIATNVGGIPEMCKQFDTGILCSSANATALAEAIATAFQPDNFALLQQRADLAQAKLGAEFTIKAQAEQTFNFYLQCYESRHQ